MNQVDFEPASPKFIQIKKRLVPKVEKLRKRMRPEKSFDEFVCAALDYFCEQVESHRIR